MRMNRPGGEQHHARELSPTSAMSVCVRLLLSFHLLLPPSGVNLTNYSFSLSRIRSRPESKLTTPRLSFKLDSPNNDKSAQPERALAQ